MILNLNLEGTLNTFLYSFIFIYLKGKMTELVIHTRTHTHACTYTQNFHLLVCCLNATNPGLGRPKLGTRSAILVSHWVAGAQVPGPLSIAF